MERPRIRRISLAILASGLLAAGIVFALADSDPADRFGSDPLAEKKYRRQLERIGGKANVLSSDFQDWFAGLWHGRSLAGTVAVLSVAGAWTFWFVATLPPLEDERRNDAHRTEPDIPGRQDG